MDESDASGVPCYSLHLIRPFLELLSSRSEVPKDALAELVAMDPDDRIPCAVAHQMLEYAVHATRDPELGLKAARLLTHGDAGAIDYLLTSGATVAEAIELMGRYMRLVNDVLDVRLELNGERAEVRLENKLPLPRAIQDFQLVSLFKNHARGWLDGTVSQLTVQTTAEAPPSTLEYERIFAPAHVTFAAPFTGFVFDKAFLHAPLRLADSKLHDVLRKHAQKTIEDLPKTQTWTDRVRTMVSEELANGNPTAAHIAQKLGLSSRTLGRKLEREGTTFSDLFDDLRKRLALQYVGSRDLNLSEVALLLGFSQTAAFHRAFRRWTDRTPLQYRRAPKK